MKKFLGLSLVSVGLVAGFIAGRLSVGTKEEEFLEGTQKVSGRPLEKYTIENLANAEIKPGKFTIKETLKEEREFTSYLFEFEFNPDLDQKTFKKTTGQINIPKADRPLPLILMLRGYIDQTRFKTGDGTRRASEIFAKKGFITIAPDFLGYGGSDEEADNIFESRFQTYVTALSLLKVFENNSEMEESEAWPSGLENIFIWGHSNGGQIALTILEITKVNYATSLWAPVSKPFPYSVLFYTDESEDRGKLIRRELAIFEEVYNPDLYSLDLYLDKISAPLQIHQGGSDDAVPKNWSDKLVTKLKKMEKEVEYYTYSGTDHNMNPVWDRVIFRDLEFFKNNLK